MFLRNAEVCETGSDFFPPFQNNFLQFSFSKYLTSKPNQNLRVIFMVTLILSALERAEPADDA
jgi:hypothetical protein